MATGDISSVTIRADGWTADVVVAGFTTGASYAYGLGTNNSPATAKVVFTITSMGFDDTGAATTKTRTVYGVRTARKAYPNQTALDETGGGNLTFRMVLSEPVYAKDKAGAGNSGTDPTVSIAAALVTNAGGSSETSSAATDLAVTNNSTLAYAAPNGCWAVLPYQRSGTSMLVEAVVLHEWACNGEQVACVKFDATDGTNSITTQTVTAATLSTLDGGSEAEVTVNGESLPLKTQVYASSLTLTALAQGVSCTARFRAYPFIGDTTSILDSQTGIAMPTDQLRNLPFICDKTGAYGDCYAVVDVADGNNATAVASANFTAADAARFTTLNAAADAIKTYNNSNYSRNTMDGGTIYVVGTVSAFTNITAGTACWLNVLPHPTEGTGATIVGGSTSLAVDGCFRFGVDFDTATALFMCHGYYAFDGCANIDISGAEAVGYNSVIWLKDSQVERLTLAGGGDPAYVALMRGTHFLTTTYPQTKSTVLTFPANVIGCQGITAAQNVYAFNTAMDFATQFAVFYNGGLASAQVPAMAMSIWERTGADGTAVMETTAATGNLTISNINFQNMTIAGNRWNHENVLDSQSVGGTASNFRVRFCIFNARGNHRTDIRNEWSDSTGFWSVDNSVGFSSNWNEASSYSGDQDFWGVNSNSATGSPTLAGFVDDKSHAGDDEGNGDYQLSATASAAAILIPAGEAGFKWDLVGRPLNQTGSGGIGALGGSSSPVIVLSGGTAGTRTITTSITADCQSPGTLIISGPNITGSTLVLTGTRGNMWLTPTIAGTGVITVSGTGNGYQMTSATENFYAAEAYPTWDANVFGVIPSAHVTLGIHTLNFAGPGGIENSYSYITTAPDTGNYMIECVGGTWFCYYIWYENGGVDQKYVYANCNGFDTASMYTVAGPWLDQDDGPVAEGQITAYLGPTGAFAIIGLTSTASGSDRVWTWTEYATADHYRASLDGGTTWSDDLATATYTATGKATMTQTIIVQALDAANNVLAQGSMAWGLDNPALRLLTLLS